MRLSDALLVVIGGAALGACVLPAEQLKQIGKEPPMSSPNLPLVRPDYEPVVWPEQFTTDQQADPPAPRYANSLWEPNARAFFKARKANRVGDILRVSVAVDDQAQLNNQTKRDRTGIDNATAPALFGMQKTLSRLIPGGGADPASLLNVTSANNTEGKGSINRGELISVEVAAMVTQILPNGNLVIHGDQEIRVNYELRRVSVDGVVRAGDISADNTVPSGLIAQARIAYGGKGQLSGLQQPRYGTQILDAVSPF